MTLFFRLILRPLLREPVRALLILAAVALGVAVVVAVDLAGQSAAGSFHASVDSLTGKTDLSITATGGVDEQLLGKLVQLPYPFVFTPRIESFAFLQGRGEAIPFIGVDLIAQAQKAGSSGDPAQQIAGSTVWVSSTLKRHRGDHLTVLINDRLHTFTVAGVIPGSGDSAASNVILADIGLAQAVTGKVGKIDAIDVLTPSSETLEHWRDLLRQNLPATVSVEPQGSRTDANRKMLSAFRWNLHVLSYIALVVGGFLIYNTISISVVRRRTDIGIVRALGGTRGFIAAGFLSEALFFAVTGTAVGLLLGRLLATAAVGLIGSTVQSLYVSSVPGPIAFTWSAALTGISLGLGISLLAALAPAFEASLISPIEAMARGREQYVAALRSRRTLGWAAAMLLVGTFAATRGPVYGKPLWAYLSVVLLIAGTSLIIPNLVAFFAAYTYKLLQTLLGVEALLAMRSLRASIGRTSVLTAALATAVAMTAAIGIMVGSFRETVWLWMDNQLKADFYLRPAGGSGADQYPTMDAAICDRLATIPGVAAIDRFRGYPITFEGLPATFAGSETSRVPDLSSTRFLPGEDRAAIFAKLPTGDFAVVSEPFANKHNVHVGSVLSVPLGGAVRDLQVLGIYYDYSTERGFLMVDRQTLLRYLPDPAVSNLALYLKPGADAAAVRRQIDDILSGHAVLVFANANLRRAAIAVFDRTFRITYALEAVAVFVAVMGIAGSLLAMVIDRRREFGLLSFLGAAKPQIRKIILCEAGLLGLLANLIGLVLGTALSLILIFVINKQSFGWTIQFHWPIALLLGALSGIYIATILAGLYPASIATRMNPMEVIHEN